MEILEILDPMTSNILSILILSLLIAINNIATYIIITYYNKKPLGNQTLFDKMISKTVLFASIEIYNISVLVYLSSNWANFTPFIAAVMVYVSNYFSNILGFWLNSVMVFKYLCIFHPILVDFEKSDDEIMMLFQVLVVFIISVLSAIDYGFFTKIEDTSPYQLLSGIQSDENKKGQPKLTTFLIIAYVLMFVFTHYKIEKRGWGLNNDTKYILRISSFLTLLFVPATFYIVLNLNIGASLQTFIVGVSMIIMLLVIPQLLFIRKSNIEMKIYAYQCVKKIIFCK